MIIEGKVLVLPDNINTDLIIAGKYTKTLDMEDLSTHVFEDIDPYINKELQGKIIVAGKNFGCGSSREQAPLAIKHAGISAVIAKSFARIFFRNAINIGLPALMCDIEHINKDDILNVNITTGVVKNQTNGYLYNSKKLSPIMLKIINYGGLTNYLKAMKDF